MLKVDLERTATLKKLLTSILDQFGDPHSTPGNELFLKRRVMAGVERFGTELLFVDEVQHLNYRSGPKNDVEDTLEGMLDAGVVPTVFLGTQDAGALVGRNLQLNGRLLPPCDFEPLRAGVKEDQRLFAGFAAKLEKATVEQGVWRSRLDWMRPVCCRQSSELVKEWRGGLSGLWPARSGWPGRSADPSCL